MTSRRPVPTSVSTRAGLAGPRGDQPIRGDLPRDPQPHLFWLCVLNAIFLVVGSLVLAGALDVAAPSLFVHSLFLAVVSMPLATLAGIAYNVCHTPDTAKIEPTLRTA